MIVSRPVDDLADHLRFGDLIMSVSMKSLGLDRLSVDERISLAEELWDSIASTTGEVELTEAHRQDLRSRLDAYRDDPQAGSPWEEVMARLQGASE
jgi:putative addiction module component (TIGR02574 family)